MNSNYYKYLKYTQIYLDKYIGSSVGENTLCFIIYDNNYKIIELLHIKQHIFINQLNKNKCVKDGFISFLDGPEKNDEKKNISITIINNKEIFNEDIIFKVFNNENEEYKISNSCDSKDDKNSMLVFSLKTAKRCNLYTKLYNLKQIENKKDFTDFLNTVNKADLTKKDVTLINNFINNKLFDCNINNNYYYFFNLIIANNIEYNKLSNKTLKTIFENFNDDELINFINSLNITKLNNFITKLNNENLNNFITKLNNKNLNNFIIKLNNKNLNNFITKLNNKNLNNFITKLDDENLNNFITKLDDENNKKIKTIRINNNMINNLNKQDLDNYIINLNEINLNNFVENLNTENKNKILNNLIENNNTENLNNFVTNLNEINLNNFVTNLNEDNLNNFVTNLNEDNLNNVVTNLNEDNLNNFVTNLNENNKNNILNNLIDIDIDTLNNVKKSMKDMINKEENKKLNNDELIKKILIDEELIKKILIDEELKKNRERMDEIRQKHNKPITGFVINVIDEKQNVNKDTYVDLQKKTNTTQKLKNITSKPTKKITINEKEIPFWIYFLSIMMTINRGSV